MSQEPIEWFAYLGNTSDRDILDGPHSADGALQHGLAVQELEVPCFPQDHLPAGALTGIVEGPAQRAAALSAIVHA